MSVLPAGRSLRQFFPDLDELLRDPAAYLGAAPVEIGPRRAYGFAALFGVLGTAFLIACAVTGVWRDEKLLLGIGLLIGAAVWLGWSVRLRGHSLLLRPDGVEVRYLDTVVWCPWALFNADGPPVVPEGDDPRVAVILPVAPEAVPFVELRRNEAPVAYGAQVRARQFRLAAPGLVVLAARYEVAAADLGSLLLQLGSRLGRRLPPGSPPPEAYPTGEGVPAEVAGPDAGGWYTVSLGRLRFPPRCCDCGEPTDAVLRFPLGAGEVVGRLTGTARPTELAVPLCPECQGRLHRAYQRGGVRGLNVGAVLGLIAAASAALAQGERGPATLAVAGLAGAAVGALIGFLAGSALPRAAPVQFRDYRPDRGTLQVRFRDPHYADLVLAASSRKHAGG
jgi:hypothetical protein